MFKLQGKVILALPKKEVPAGIGGWISQEYVIETFGRYPKKVVFKVFGIERINKFNIQVGQDIEVSFEINAQQWNGKWYNTFLAYRVCAIKR